MSTFDDFMIGQAVKNDEERDKLRTRALRAEAREKELREALGQGIELMKMKFGCAPDANCAECDLEIRPWVTLAEKLLSGEPEKEK